jgi:hypothetical protein
LNGCAPTSGPRSSRHPDTSAIKTSAPRIARWDGLRRKGNILATSELPDGSTVLRYTIGVAVKLVASLQLEASIERYDFSDFDDEHAAHLGIAGPF